MHVNLCCFFQGLAMRNFFGIGDSSVTSIKQFWNIAVLPMLRQERKSELVEAQGSTTCTAHKLLINKLNETLISVSMLPLTGALEAVKRIATIEKMLELDERIEDK